LLCFANRFCGFRIPHLIIPFEKILKLSSLPQSSLPSYTLKVSKDGKDYNVDVSANIRDGSETFHLNEASSGRDAGDIIYDLKRVIIMITLCVRGVSYSRPWSERGGRDELDSASPSVLVETVILISAKSEILIVIKN